MSVEFNIHNCDFEQLYKEAQTQTNDSSSSLLHDTFEHDKYSVKKELGRGGTKKVSHIYDNFSRRDVAMAELIDPTEADKFEPFIKEAWLTAQLDHPNIIKVYDIGLNNDHSPFFTMELKTGHSLKGILPLRPIDELLEIFIKICNAVSYAHSKNILHLDLKPENIQIGSFGEVLVCDWEMGRLVKTEEETDPEKVMLYAELRKNALNNEKYIAGTPGFMAPEQFSKNSELTEQTDIFGLGALLYNLLTETAPFYGTFNEIKQQTINGKFELPIKKNPEIPSSINAIIEKCLSPAPENRYQSVTEILAEINKFRQGFSTYAENAGFIKESQLFFKRNRIICMTIALFFMILLGTTSTFIINLENSRKQERRERQKAQQSLQLYKTEKSARADLASDYSKNIAAGSRFLDNKLFFYNPERVTKQAESEITRLLNHQKENPQLLAQLAYVQFISQRYTKAVEIISKHKLIELKPLVEITKKLKLSVKTKVSINSFAMLIRELKRYGLDPALVIKLVSFDYFKRSRRHNPAGSYEEIVKALLEYYNPEWDSSNFLYMRENKSLTLSGKELKRLALFWKGDDRSFLRFIPIKDLVINNSNFYDLTHLRGLKLKTLNIAGTKVQKLEGLSTMKTLTTLTLHLKQIKQSQKLLLLKKVKIIELNSE